MAAGRRTRKWVLAVVLVTGSTVATSVRADIVDATPVTSTPVPSSPVPRAESAVGRLLVKRETGTSIRGAMSEAASFLADVGVDEADVSRTLRLGHQWEVLDLGVDVSLEAAERLAAELDDRSDVLAVEIDRRIESLAVPNDPLWSSQWSLQPWTSSARGIGVESAWNTTTGSSEIVVAVIDTGRLDHPDLAGRLVDGYDFVSGLSAANDGDGWDPDESDPGDYCGGTSSSFHGTHVAGLIGAVADNGIGVSGVDRAARIQHVRVLGRCGGSVVDEVAAIKWAAGLAVPGVPVNPTPARVINLSLGAVGACSTAEQEAIDLAVAAGSIVVVASGNSNQNLDVTSFAPASCNNVVTVGGTDQTANRWTSGGNGANYGTAVEISAPAGGPGLISTMNDSNTSPSLGTWNYETKQGTSMAAPLVSGVVSLMLATNPALDSTAITQILRSTANAFPSGSTCSTSTCGSGVVDAADAVQTAAFGAPDLFTSLSPARILDTRDTAPVSTSNVVQLDVTGTANVPASGVSAVALNVTATGATAEGYVTVWPCAAGKASTSVVNYTAGDDIPNAVVATVDPYGRICIDSFSEVDVVVDVMGWFRSTAGLTTFAPRRVFDTRSTSRVSPGAPHEFDFTGVTDTNGATLVPVTGVDAVILNVTVSRGVGAGFLTVWPCGTPQPATSSLNYRMSQDIPNLVIAKVGADGRVCFASNLAAVDVIADLNGWIASGTSLRTVTPERLFDTRDSGNRLEGGPYELTLGSSVSSTATTVVLNVTATGAAAPGYATVWPCGEPRPNTSNLNYSLGEDIPNTVIVKIGAGGRVCFATSAPVHLIADLLGWFEG